MKTISTKAIGSQYEVKGKKATQYRCMLQQLGYIASKPVRKGARTFELLEELPLTGRIIIDEFNRKFRTASPSDIFNDAKNELEELSSEMSEWRDNMGENEGLAQTEKFERVEAAADTLENVVGNLEDVADYIEAMGNVAAYADIVYVLPYDQLKGTDASSRSRRAANAAAQLQALYNRLNASVWAFPDEELQMTIDALDEAINEVDAIEFPGMFG